MKENSFGAILGQLVYTKRKILGLTQIQLAEDAFETAGKTRRISELERGQVANPHATTIDPIIATLGISEAELEECAKAAVSEPDSMLNAAYPEANELLDKSAEQFDNSNPDASLAEIGGSLDAKGTVARKSKTSRTSDSHQTYDEGETDVLYWSVSKKELRTNALEREYSHLSRKRYSRRVRGVSDPNSSATFLQKNMNKAAILTISGFPGSGKGHYLRSILRKLQNDGVVLKYINTEQPPKNICTSLKKSVSTKVVLVINHKVDRNFVTSLRNHLIRNGVKCGIAIVTGFSHNHDMHFAPSRNENLSNQANQKYARWFLQSLLKAERKKGLKSSFSPKGTNLRFNLRMLARAKSGENPFDAIDVQGVILQEYGIDFEGITDSFSNRDYLDICFALMSRRLDNERSSGNQRRFWEKLSTLNLISMQEGYWINFTDFEVRVLLALRVIEYYCEVDTAMMEDKLSSMDLEEAISSRIFFLNSIANNLGFFSEGAFSGHFEKTFFSCMYSRPSRKALQQAAVLKLVSNKNAELLFRQMLVDYQEKLENDLLVFEEICRAAAVDCPARSIVDFVEERISNESVGQKRPFLKSALRLGAGKFQLAAFETIAEEAHFDFPDFDILDVFCHVLSKGNIHDRDTYFQQVHDLLPFFMEKWCGATGTSKLLSILFELGHNGKKELDWFRIWLHSSDTDGLAHANLYKSSALFRDWLRGGGEWRNISDLFHCWYWRRPKDDLSRITVLLLSLCREIESYHTRLGREERKEERSLFLESIDTIIRDLFTIRRHDVRNSLASLLKQLAMASDTDRTLVSDYIIENLADPERVMSSTHDVELYSKSRLSSSHADEYHLQVLKNILSEIQISNMSDAERTFCVDQLWSVRRQNITDAEIETMEKLFFALLEKGSRAARRHAYFRYEFSNQN